MPLRHGGVEVLTSVLDGGEQLASCALTALPMVIEPLVPIR